MKRFNKVLGLILTLIFTLGIFVYSPITAEASYTYRIKLLLGNNEHAYFDETGVESLRAAGYTVEYPVVRTTDSKKLTNQLIISGLGYNASVTFNVDSLIKIDNTEAEANGTKYYVKGLRISGADDVLKTDSSKNLTLNVTGDESYVVAYGVGATIPYTARYVDKDENQLLDDDTLYAAEGEIIFVPSRHISGYTPDAYFKTASKGLKKDTVFTFVYTKGEPTIIYNEEIVDVETTENVDGGTEYDYEYQYVDGGTTVVTTGGGTTSSTVTETVTTQEAGTVNNRQETTDNNANAAGEGDSQDAEPAQNNDSTTIADENTPTDVVDIDDEETAKAGGERDKFIRNMIIGIIIAIIAIVSILVTLYVADKKRKRELVKVQNHKDESK